jgi:hypothetical protein
VIILIIVAAISLALLAGLVLPLLMGGF